MSFVASMGRWRQEGMSLAQCVDAAVRGAVLDGRIPVGTPLPSERVLGRQLDISRGTVVAALALLREGGWVRTRHGSGSVLCLPAHLTTRTAPWSLDQGGDGVELDMRLAVTAAPHAHYLAALHRAVERCAPQLCDSGTPDGGLPGLRALLAGQYTREGLPTTPEQILVTSGATAALMLLADHFHDRRRPFVVESPTYPGALAVLRRRRTRLVSIPVTAQGWERPTDVIRSAGAGLVYLTPDFHNPSGMLMPDDVREQIAAMAERLDVPVVADETMRELDLRTPPQPVPRLRGARVITIGSTSKTIWGGLRVGWIRARASDVRELMLNPMQGSLTPPPLEQLIAEELLGDVGQILTDRLASLRTQRDHLVQLLAGRDEWTFDVPLGGLAVWLHLRHTTGPALAAAARRRGLALASGPEFSVDRTLTRYLRLPFTAAPEVLTRAVALLG
ncbi:PLP-dependent aminotransferase family protein [Plantactinospora solaniradicis]|uniref:PLP-dependent aminotransferase family protein n=1 Tax=Plantactinospora solaniradicis TaxID=1723736 RepID=A0ABW1K2X6_9ACTN